MLKDPGTDAGLAELDRWEGELRRVQLEPVTELDLVLRWLRERAPAGSTRTVLVHGDFKPGNALLSGDRISAVLDWETAHLGDPMEDLGWITNPVREQEHQIPGPLGARPDRRGLLASRPDARSTTTTLLWWNVFSCWKLAVIVLTGDVRVRRRPFRPRAPQPDLARPRDAADDWREADEADGR